eukprot:TRINITY_DN18473_c1_g1_i1.p1 TRINITY_DN18473_c1_g1~~TRINITY_DN18473_c1_g1_i1.p1  ORF type:complete len:643 (+),score=117.53 TRINITY_DN18473_c1_g1_i1:86-2014(+)
MGATFTQHIDLERVGSTRRNLRINERRLHKLRSLYDQALHANVHASYRSIQAPRKPPDAWDQALREAAVTTPFEQPCESGKLAHRLHAMVAVQGWGILGLQHDATARKISGEQLEHRKAPLPERDCIVVAPVDAGIVKANAPHSATGGALAVFDWYGLTAARGFVRPLREKMRTPGSVFLHRYAEGWVLHACTPALSACGEDDPDKAAELVGFTYFNCLRAVGKAIVESEPLPTPPPSAPGTRVSTAAAPAPTGAPPPKLPPSVGVVPPAASGGARPGSAGRPPVRPPSAGQPRTPVGARAASPQRPGSRPSSAGTSAGQPVQWIGRPGSAGSRDGGPQQVLLRLPSLGRHAAPKRLRCWWPAVVTSALRRAIVRLCDSANEQARVLGERLRGIELCIYRQKELDAFRQCWRAPSPERYAAGLRTLVRDLERAVAAGAPAWTGYPPTPRAVSAAACGLQFGPLMWTTLAALGPYVQREGHTESRADTPAESRAGTRHDSCGSRGSGLGSPLRDVAFVFEEPPQPPAAQSDLWHARPGVHLNDAQRALSGMLSVLSTPEGPQGQSPAVQTADVRNWLHNDVYAGRSWATLYDIHVGITVHPQMQEHASAWVAAVCNDFFALPRPPPADFVTSVEEEEPLVLFD